MKFRLLIAVVAILVVAAPVGAETLLTNEDESHCQLLMPFVWQDLPRGGTMTEVVELDGCAPEFSSWFRFYGFISGGNTFDGLRVGDGVVLTAEDLSTGGKYTFSDTNRKSQIMIMVPVAGQTRIRLTAVNTSRQTKSVRMTWRQVN